MDVSDEAVRVDPQGHVIVTGDIDVVSAPIIEGAIRRAEAMISDTTALVLDVGKVAFIDSSGLRVLLAASRRNEQFGRRVRLRSPGSTITRLLDITGTSAMFDLDPVS